MHFSTCENTAIQESRSARDKLSEIQMSVKLELTLILKPAQVWRNPPWKTDVQVQRTWPTLGALRPYPVVNLNNDYNMSTNTENSWNIVALKIKLWFLWKLNMHCILVLLSKLNFKISSVIHCWLIVMDSRFARYWASAAIIRNYSSQKCVRKQDGQISQMHCILIYIYCMVLQSLKGWIYP